MDVLRGIVQNLLVIILLTVLLEMLLPRGDMRRYVHLIMGLFVIMVVLNPVLSLFRGGINFDAVNFDSREDEAGLAAAVARGKEMGARQKQQALKGLQENINSQVMALVGLNKTIKVTAVEVELVDDPQAENFGGIKRILLKTGSSGNQGQRTPGGEGDGFREVAPVDIKVPEMRGDQTPMDGRKPALATGQEELRRILADFYGLNPEQIEFGRR